MITYKQYQRFSQKLKNYYNHCRQVEINAFPQDSHESPLEVINIWLNFDSVEGKVVTVKQFSNGKFGQPVSYDTSDIQSLLDMTDYE